MKGGAVQLPLKFEYNMQSWVVCIWVATQCLLRPSCLQKYQCIENYAVYLKPITSRALYNYMQHCILVKVKCFKRD